MSSDCDVCRRVERLTPENPYLVAELETGYAMLADNQHIPGYTLFVSKTCVPELHDLSPDVRSRFLDEMALVAEAVFSAFTPRKLNYELLGNSVSHLHWHIFPRYQDDPNPEWPVWSNDEFLRAPRITPLPPAELAERRERLQLALARLRTEPASPPPAGERGRG